MGVQVDMKDELNMKLENAENKQVIVDVLTFGVAPLAPANAVSSTRIRISIHHQAIDVHIPVRSSCSNHCMDMSTYSIHLFG
jgi:hypothetical protein